MQYCKKSVLLACLLILTACTAAPAPTPTPTAIPDTPTPIPPTPTAAIPQIETLDIDQLLPFFTYDSTVPFDVVIVDENQDETKTWQTLHYIGGMGFEVPAILMVPNGEGPYPAVIFVHKGGGNRTQFLLDAELLAEMGVASLLLDSPFNPRPWGGEYPRADYPADIRTGIIRQVLDIRRGVDLLESLPQIDSSRLGYVGHSLGATFRGVAARVEDRIRAYVLMAGTAQFSTILPEDFLDISVYDDLDAVHYIGHAAPAALLFQFAEDDLTILESDANLYSSAASQPKDVRWYPGTHTSLEWTSMEDRLQWLGEQLGFDYIPQE